MLKTLNFSIICSGNVYLFFFPSIGILNKKEQQGFPGGTVVENLPANAGDTVRALVWEDPTCRGATGPMSHNY